MTMSFDGLLKSLEINLEKRNSMSYSSLYKAPDSAKFWVRTSDTMMVLKRRLTKSSKEPMI